MCVMASLRSKSLALCNFRLLKGFLTELHFKKYHQQWNLKSCLPKHENVSEICTALTLISDGENECACMPHMTAVIETQ